MSTDELREKLAWASIPTLQRAKNAPLGHDLKPLSEELVDALLPIIDAHVAETREQIAGRLDAETDRATAEHARVRLPFEFGLAEAYGVAARIVRGQA